MVHAGIVNIISERDAAQYVAGLKFANIKKEGSNAKNATVLQFANTTE